MVSYTSIQIDLANCLAELYRTKERFDDLHSCSRSHISLTDYQAICSYYSKIIEVIKKINDQFSRVFEDSPQLGDFNSLKKYSEPGRCSKCGNLNAGVKLVKKPEILQGEYKMREVLERECPKCWYIWNEKPLDSKN
jgi:hypothetical protein